MSFQGSQFRKLFSEMSATRGGTDMPRPKQFHKNETKTKPEPWNPVQITFDLPVDAAKRLSQLAEGDDEAALRELGIISFQIQGEKIISLSLPTPKVVENSENATSTTPSRVPTPSTTAAEFLKSASALTSLKRAAPGAERTTFTSFKDVNLTPPEKKRRKQVSTSKDFSSTGALPYLSGMSEVLATAADGSHPLLHRTALSRSASSTISSSGGPNTHTSVFSRLTKTPASDSLMPPPPPLSGDSSSTDVLKKSRSIRLNPNTGLMESGVSGGETSSEGEADHDSEARIMKSSLDLSIVKSERRPNADLKLKLKLPSRNPAASARSADKKRSESQQQMQPDEPKLPKLILSMRDKTVKMAASKASKASFVESGQDYDDGDDGDDDDEEFDGSKLKSPQNSLATLTGRAAIDRVLSAPSSVATCDTKNEHFEIRTSSPESAELDSPRWNNHSEENIKCKDEISLRLSDKAIAAATSSKNPSMSEVKIRNNLSSSSAAAAVVEQHKNEKEKFQQQLVIDKKHLEDSVSETAASASSNEVKSDKFPSTSHADAASRFAESFNLASRESDSHAHQGDDSGIESMDTLSEKSPNQGENDDKMIELKDLVEPTSAASPAPVRPLSLSCDVENDATSNIDKEKASTTSSSEEEVSEESKDVVIEETTLETSETKVGASNEVEKKEDRESPILSSPAETLQTTIEPSLEVAQEAESDQVEVKLEVEADVNLMASEQSTKDEVEAKVDMEEIKNDLSVNDKSETDVSETVPQIVEEVKAEGESIIDVSITATATITAPEDDDVTPNVVEEVSSPVELDHNLSEDECGKMSNPFLSSRSASVWLNSESNSSVNPTDANPRPVVVTNPAVVAEQQQQPLQHVTTTTATATLTKVETLASVLTTSGLTLQPSTLRRSPAPPTTTSTLNGGYSSAGLQTMRSALNVPAGAKMVPVKLVSVSGEGNVRLVRVSPVKTALHHTNDGTSVLSPRTVVIKSSMLKTVAAAASASVPTNPTPLPAHLANSQPLSPSLLNNVCKETTSVGPPTSVYNLINNSTASDTNHKPVASQASVIGNVELLQTKEKIEQPPTPFSIPAEMKLLSAPTLAAPIPGPSLSITPVWNHVGAVTSTPGPTPLSTSLSVKEVVDKNISKVAVNNDVSTAFALRSLEPIPSPKIELEVDTKKVGGRNRPQKKSPVSMNSDFGGSLLRPLLQKEEPVTDLKAKPKLKPDSDAPKLVETIPNSLPKAEQETSFDANCKGFTNERTKNDEECINDLDQKLGLKEESKPAAKKSGRLKNNTETNKGQPMTPKPKATTPTNATSGVGDDPKERRSVRQNPANDVSMKTMTPKMAPKKIPNSIIIGLDKDSSTITDFTSSTATATTTPKSKRVTTTTTTTASVTANVSQTTLGMNATSLGNSCNVVVETNKNLAQKRIKTRSAKTTSDEQMEMKRRRLKIENS